MSPILKRLTKFKIGFLNNVTFNNHETTPTLLNLWSVQDGLVGDNLVYHIDKPQHIQLVLQGT